MAHLVWGLIIAGGKSEQLNTGGADVALLNLAGKPCEEIVVLHYTAKNGQTTQICHVGSSKAHLDLLFDIKQVKKICLYLRV